MHQQHSQINTLLFIVAILAVVGGLAIVIVTSPQSWQFGPVAYIQSLAGTPVRATRTPSPSPSPTPAPPTASATTTARPTFVILTVTAAPSDTPTPELTVTPTAPALPTDVRALAVVVVSPGTNSARVRDQPNGQSVIAAVAGGTQVQVLFGQVKVGGTNWDQVRLADGQVGWMAEFLLQITQSRP
jgi:cytoskeletal protein RodZ